MIVNAHVATVATKVGIYIVPAAHGQILLNDMTAEFYEEEGAPLVIKIVPIACVCSDSFACDLD